MADCNCAARRLRTLGHYAACLGDLCNCAENRLEAAGHYATCRFSEPKPIQLGPTEFKLYIAQRVREATAIAKDAGSTDYEQGWAEALKTIMDDLSSGRYAEYLDRKILTKYSM